MTATEVPPVDDARLEQVLGQVVTDMGAAINAVLVMIGDELGLWAAMRGAGPMTVTALSDRTGINEKYLHEWLGAQAASSYLEYDAAAETFTLSPEQALAFADPNSPAYMMGGYHILSSAFRDRGPITDALREGRGFGWHEHDPELFLGTEQFFRPGYRTHLAAEWLPAIEGMVEKLDAGCAVADIGCGHGASTVVMASAYPNSTFRGFDYHQPSIDRARAAAEESGLSGRCSFERATAKDFPGENYDLICFFDCLHDMGDPVGALKHSRDALAPDGAIMLVEPYANDRLADNLNPVGRMFYAASTLICTPSSLDQEVGAGLGAQAGEGRLAQIAAEAGLTRFRRAAETPVNLILEAKL